MNPQPLRRPVHRSTTTLQGSAAVATSVLIGTGYAVVRTTRSKDPNRAMFNSLNSNTRFVHIVGYPFLWAVKEILNRAPNLKTLQVIPMMLPKMHPNSHLRLCKEHGVSVQAGHYKPELAWDDDEFRPTATYRAHEAFLRNLTGDQKVLFDELLLFGIMSAEITRRYFCLGGENPIALGVLGGEYGYGKESGQEQSHRISSQIYAVLHYLDHSFEVNNRSTAIARNLERRVERLRSFLNSAAVTEDTRQRIAQKIGLQSLPINFPLARVEILQGVIVAKRDGRFEQLRKSHPNHLQALELRLGVEGSGVSTYRTLEEVAHCISPDHIYTRERIRQFEERALDLLGIQEES